MIPEAIALPRVSPMGPVTIALPQCTFFLCVIKDAIFLFKYLLQHFIVEDT